MVDRRGMVEEARLEAVDRVVEGLGLVAEGAPPGEVDRVVEVAVRVVVAVAGLLVEEDLVAPVVDRLEVVVEAVDLVVEVVEAADQVEEEEVDLLVEEVDLVEEAEVVAVPHAVVETSNIKYSSTHQNDKHNTKNIRPTIPR